jgi:hypothetical protein
MSHYKHTCLTEPFKFIEAVAPPDLEVEYSRIIQCHTVDPSVTPDHEIRIYHCIVFMSNKIKILECPSRDIMCKCGSQHLSASQPAPKTVMPKIIMHLNFKLFAPM